MSLPIDNDPTKPSYQRPEVLAAAPDLTLITDLLGGPRAMWHKREGYIRKWADEEWAVYELRSLCEPLAELFARTLSASSGKLFAKPPKLTFPTNETVLRAHWDNIDGTGKKGDVAIRAFADDSMAQGIGLILVDHPSPPAGTVVTVQTERDMALRPQWRFYTYDAVCSWRTQVINNVETLVQVVLAEAGEEPLDAFGVASVQFYRELYVDGGVAGWRLWRAPVANGEFTIEGAGTFTNARRETRNTLPLAIAYAGRQRKTLVATPPLRAVAYANLAHWQIATELRFGSNVTAIEQFVVNGQLQPNADGSPGKIKLGWVNALQVQEGGGAGWVGPSGAGLDQLAKRKVEKEQEIAALGLSFLSRDTRAAETAEAKKLDASAEDSTLATVAQAVEDAVNQAWVDHVWYMGLTKADAPTVSLNRDYGENGLSPQMLTALAAMVREGMPVRVALQQMQHRGLLAADVDLDELEADWLAGQVEARDAEAERRDAATERLRQAA